MSATALAAHTTTPPLSDTRRQLSQLLEGAHESSIIDVTVDARTCRLDPQVAGAVKDLLERLSIGQAVMVSTVDSLMTTGQAARLLGMSRTYVCRLLDEGKLPVHYTGTHRRVRIADLADFVKRQERVKREALHETQRISHEAGLYDGDDF